MILSWQSVFSCLVPTCLRVNTPVHMFVCPIVCLSVCLPVCPMACLSVRPFVCVSVYLSVCPALYCPIYLTCLLYFFLTPVLLGLVYLCTCSLSPQRLENHECKKLLQTDSSFKYYRGVLAGAMQKPPVIPYL